MGKSRTQLLRTNERNKKNQNPFNSKSPKSGMGNEKLWQIDFRFCLSAARETFEQPPQKPSKSISFRFFYRMSNYVECNLNDSRRENGRTYEHFGSINKVFSADIRSGAMSFDEK